MSDIGVSDSGAPDSGAPDSGVHDSDTTDGGEQRETFLLAVSIDTGAVFDLGKVKAVMSDHAPLDTSDATPLDGFPAAVTSVLDQQAVVWSQPLRSSEMDAWSSFPDSVQLTFAVDGGGVLLVAAVSDQRDDVLSVLTSGGIDGHDTATFGYPLTSDQPLTHPLLGLDPRANMLAELGFRAYRALEENGAVSSGPEVVCSTYGCDEGRVIPGFDRRPFQLYNGLTRDIVLLQSALFASQSDTHWACGCPFDGIAFADGPWAPLEAALNQAWNPKESDTTDGSASRSFSLSYGDVQASYLSARADGDNSNSGSVTLDLKIVSEFSGWDEASHFYRQPGLTPSGIFMQLSNTWSASSAVFCIAILGDIPDVLEVTEDPQGGMDGNPPPHRWVVHPGWNR